MRLQVFSLLFALSLAPVQAEQLTVRNHPFKGRLTGTGAQLSASLPELAEALSWGISESHGRTSVLVTGAPPDVGTEPGVWVNGTRVKAVSENGELQVKVEEFARAAGLSYIVNGDTAQLTLNRGPKAAAAAGPTIPFDGKPIEINQNTPGAYVDLQTLPVAGKLTFILIYSPDIRNPIYVHIPFRIDIVAKNPEVVLYKINAGGASSPFSQAYHYPAQSPMMLIYAKNRGYFSLTGGHHLQTDLIDHPDEFIHKELEVLKTPHLMTGRYGDPRLQRL
jgi:hypothetical protein